LRDALVNKKFNSERVIGDKAGLFEYYAGKGTTNLEYRVYDLYSINSQRMYNDKFGSNDTSKSLLGFVLELEQFIMNYRTDEV
jgi:hypothetical protein